MDRRTFVQSLAAWSGARRLAGALGVQADAQAPDAAASVARATQNGSKLPAVRVVSAYAPTAAPGMPGPFPGRVVSVRSDKCVDTSTGTADDATVREMMARGMRALTGASTTSDAWRRFFAPADIVGIKVNCGGYPHCVSAYEIVAET